MDYAYLGRSGLQVSRLALGTMNFGMETSEADSFAILDEALESGINFVDTADVYGGAPVSGHSSGLWHLRGVHRAVAGAGRSPRADRPGDEGLPADGPWPQRSQAVGLPHPE